MTTATPAISKLLLLACDQSYFDAQHPVSGHLQSLSDNTSNDPAYANPDIYRSTPQFEADGICSSYTFYRTIERPGSGAKLVIYKNANNDVIVAFGGTDGADAKDWVANSQSVGWSQWAALKQDISPSDKGLFGVLAELGSINQLNFTGQSLGGALAQYAAYEYVSNQRKADQSGNYVPSKVSLTTFNGLGAVWGLTDNIKN